MSTAVQERLSITVDEAKHHLRVDGSDDDLLIEEFITSAKASADQFLNNPFQASDGTLLAIPEPIKTWCLRRVALLHEQRVEGLRADAVNAIGSTDFGRAISDTGGSTDFSLIRPFRLNPGL